MNDLSKNIALQKEEDEVDIAELFEIIIDGKIIILLIVLFSTLLSGIYAFGSSPIFESDTLLQIESKKSGVPGIEELTGLGGDEASITTEIEVVKSRKILGEVITDLQQDILTEPKRIPFIGNIFKQFYSPDDVKQLPLLWTKFDDFAKKYAWGNEFVKIDRFDVPEKFLDESFNLIVQSEDSFEISVFISEINARPGTHFKLIKKSHLEAIQTLKERISVSEKGKKSGIISLKLQGNDKQTILNTLDLISKNYLEQNKSRSSEEASNALKFLNEQIKPVKEKVDSAEAKLQTYRTTNNTADMSMETQTVLKIVSEIDTELQRLSLKKDQLGLKYTETHPTLLAIKSNEKKLKERKNETLLKITKLPKTQQQLLKLKSDYNVTNSIYIDLLNDIQEFKIAKALGILIVFMRNMLDKSIRNPEIIEETLGLPVYATIPFSKDVRLTRGLKKSKQKQKTLLATQDNKDPAIESLRNLRTSLQFALLESKNNIIMITGPSPGIGKSFISSNLAAVLAGVEKKTLLIDVDMRKGYLDKLLNIDISPGLSELITENAKLEDVIHTFKVGAQSMDVILRGKTPPNPSELLMHNNFEKILTKLSDQYDYIILDTPPVHAVTDPGIIGRHAGVVFMVVRYDNHTLSEIEHAVMRLTHTGVHTKGFIFNGFIPKTGRSGSYGYNSYYSEYRSE